MEFRRVLFRSYQIINVLRVEVDAHGARGERRIFGYTLKRHTIARADIAGIEPRVSARLQNVFNRSTAVCTAAPHAARCAGDGYNSRHVRDRPPAVTPIIFV